MSIVMSEGAFVRRIPSGVEEQSGFVATSAFCRGVFHMVKGGNAQQ
jgi:hypothetical protein